MATQTPLIELECSGSFHQMGVFQGRHFKREKEKILHSLISNRFVPTWLKLLGKPALKSLLLAKGLTLLGTHSANIRKFAPSEYQRMRGIAEGLRMPLPMLLSLHSIETIAANLEYVMGCTSIGVGPSRSKLRSPHLAYNHDFPDFLRDHLFIRRSNPKKGLSSLQLSYPSMAGAICGLNSAGVAITLNHAFSKEPPSHGVPPTFLVQEALDHCRNTEEVLKLFRRVRFSCGSMATVIDEKGDMLALELARSRFGVRPAQKEILVTFNAYQIPALQEIEVPQEAHYHPKKFPPFFHGIPIHFHNWERKKRMAVLLKNRRKFDPKDLKALLSDHHGKNKGHLGTICRHHPTSETIATAILHPRERVIEAGRGFACRANYRVFSL